MASMKLKAAYVLSILSSFIWLSVFLVVCFPSGRWSGPVRFPNYSMLLLFLSSGAVAAISFSTIGLSYLGLSSAIGQRSKETPQAAELTKTILLSQRASDGGIEEAELQKSIPQEAPVTILVPELEKEQENK